MLVMMMWIGSLRSGLFEFLRIDLPPPEETIPKIAKLFASVPELVKIISRGRAPKTLATRIRASSRIFLATKPSLCKPPGLPKPSAGVPEA